MTPRLTFSLTQLEYVLAVHRHGHFAKAAKACHVTQPTLSMQVQKLEEQLGGALFDRAKKPVLLTDLGKKIIAQIQATVHESRKIETMVHSISSHEPEGELKLGVIPTVAPYILPRLLPGLEKKFPKISLDIAEMHTQEITRALADDELDVGLLATPLKLSQIFERPVFYEPFLILCHKGHPLSKTKRVDYSDLTFGDIWLLSEGHCLRHQALDICAHKRRKEPSPKYHFESGSLETLKRLVDAYGGYTLLPMLATDEWGPKSELVKFAPPAPGREIGLVYRRKHYKAGLIDALADALSACIPESLRKIRRKDLDVIPIEG